MGILVVIDGMTDERFTLAQMPVLQGLAENGAYGLLETTPTGCETETTVCILSLLGVETARIQAAGRGWLEALGAGIPFGENDLLCKASWVSLNEEEQITGLCAAAPHFNAPGYHYLRGWQALLVVHGAAGGLQGLCLSSPHQCIGRALAQAWPSGSNVLDTLCRTAKTKSLALIPWGAAAPGELPHIEGCAITATAGVRGIACAVGMEIWDAASVTGDTDTDVNQKVQAALAAAKTAPFVLLHINGADEAAHRLDGEGKRAFLQRVDEALATLAESGHRLLLCADHGTSPATGRHINAPQPFVLVNSTRHGDLGLLPGGAATRLLQEEG